MVAVVDIGAVDDTHALAGDEACIGACAIKVTASTPGAAVHGAVAAHATTSLVTLICVGRCGIGPAIAGGSIDEGYICWTAIRQERHAAPHLAVEPGWAGLIATALKLGVC